MSARTLQKFSPTRPKAQSGTINDTTPNYPDPTREESSECQKGLKQVGFAREAYVLRQKLESPLGSYGELIGKSATMRQVYQRLSQIAPTDAAVLVSGESGTARSLSRGFFTIFPKA